MESFVAAFAIFAAALFLMAVGVILGNRRLKGSCGGLAGMTDEHGNSICEACSSPSENCTRSFGNRSASTEYSEAGNSGREPADSDPTDDRERPWAQHTV